jgi:hypothetical protein
MSDEFDYRDWKEDLYDGLRNRDTWFRGVKILFLSLFLVAVRVVLVLLTIFQFCHYLFRNRPSEIVMQAGPWLARYVELIILYVTWSTDYAPFPFAPLRDIGEDGGYDYGESSSGVEEGSSGYEEERYDSEPPAPPPGAEDALPEDNGGVSEDEALPEDESTDEGDDDHPAPPPRPDA